ncbi:DUF1488 family protein [Ottowia testudinis]|uniref:DUF1488 family protein n=1 Tax=Ottowia testudinis TaxID=2816950 RepID=A0A975H554_9BURK|nr:DUF1488 family protein [Ottowia testudinis]QTD47085.1 DUF1488 family protein [Ottowia testudinis]
MSNLELIDVSAPDVSGVRFTARHDGQAHTVFLTSEALEDVEYQHYDSSADLLAAFERQRALIATHVAQALASGASGEVRIGSLH